MKITVDENKLDLCDSIITIVYECGEEEKSNGVFTYKAPKFAVEVIFHNGQYDEPITLGSIRRKYGDKIHLVVSEYGLEGRVYRYGNNGKYWEQIGRTDGYA